MLYDLLLVDEDGEETRLSPWDSDERLVARNQVRVEGRCWEIVHLRHDMDAELISLKAEPCVVEHDPDLDAAG